MATSVPSTSLCVGDLHSETTEAELRARFNTVASVTHLQILKSGAVSLGLAYITFDTIQDAQKAMNRLNFTTFHGKPCYLTFASSGFQKQQIRGGISELDSNQQKSDTIRKRSQYTNSVHPKNNNAVGKLFIKNIHSDMDVTSVRNEFSQFGPLTYIRIRQDDEGRNLGYGSLKYNSSDAAQNALEQMNGKEITSRKDPDIKCTISVEQFVHANQRHKMVRGKRVITNTYYNNLPPTMTDEEFEQMVTVNGKRQVTSTALKLHKEKNLKYGFANFASLEEAEEAVQELYGCEIDGYTVYADFHQPQNVRSKYLQKKHNRRCN
ncbi:hypothetical protein P9112_008644 [Eukaryota sp. TZLM1-RC]